MRRRVVLMCANVALLVSITTAQAVAAKSRRDDFAASIQTTPDPAVSSGSVVFATHPEASEALVFWLDLAIRNKADNLGYPMSDLLT